MPPRIINARISAKDKKLFEALPIHYQDILLGVLSGSTWHDAYSASQFTDNIPPEKCKHRVKKIIEDPRIVKIMTSIQSRTLGNAILTRDQAMAVLSKQATASLDDFIKFNSKFMGMDDDTGEPKWITTFQLKRDEEIDIDLMSNIAEIQDTQHGIKFKLHNQREAMALLGKMQGWESATKHIHEVTGKDGGPIEKAELSKDDYKQIRKEMLKQDDC